MPSQIKINDDKPHTILKPALPYKFSAYKTDLASFYISLIYSSFISALKNTTMIKAMLHVKAVRIFSYALLFFFTYKIV
jgi:hypothetical protein